jgi:hypothetical protein
MTDADLVAKASGLDRAAIVSLWEAVKSPAPLKEWNGPGKALEYCLVRAFQLELNETDCGWPFSVTSPNHRLGILEQIDGVVYAAFGTFLIEAKADKEPVDVEPLAKLRFRLEARPPGTMGMLASVSGFTEPARLYAQFAVPLNVLLWTGDDLDAALRTGSVLKGLQRKLRMAIERRIPDYRLEAEA